MLEKLKEIEQELMDELSPEAYSDVKEYLLINSKVVTPHETALYKAGYLDGLQAAILLSSENSTTNSYTIDLEDIF